MRLVAKNSSGRSSGRSRTTWPVGPSTKADQHAHRVSALIPLRPIHRDRVSCRHRLARAPQSSRANAAAWIRHACAVEPLRDSMRPATSSDLVARTIHEYCSQPNPFFHGRQWRPSQQAMPTTGIRRRHPYPRGFAMNRALCIAALAISLGACSSPAPQATSSPAPDTQTAATAPPPESKPDANAVNPDAIQALKDMG